MKKLNAQAFIILVTILIFINYLPLNAQQESTNDLNKPALSISGFVNAGYIYEVSSGNNTFSLNHVELDLLKDIGEFAAVQADLDFIDNGQGGFDVDVEQAYISLSRLFSGSVEFTFGKFGAPIGFEGVDPFDNNAASFSYVYDYASPNFITGLMCTHEFSEALSLDVYAGNGQDVNLENNKSKTLGGYLSITPSGNSSIGLAAIYGPERDNNDSNNYLVLDTDFSYELSDKISFGGEIAYGKEEHSDSAYTGIDDSWMGFLIQSDIWLAENIQMTLRYDMFKFNEWSRFTEDDNPADKSLTVSEITVSPAYFINPDCRINFEWRIDFSSEKVFDNNEKTANTFRVQMTHLF